MYEIKNKNKFIGILIDPIFSLKLDETKNKSEKIYNIYIAP